MDTSPERILLIRPSALGDVCRTVPVLVSLRRAFPDAAIDWLVQDTFSDAVAGHPDLSEVIRFPRSRFHRWWMPPTAADIMRWCGSLRARRYDMVIDCQGLARSGGFAWMTRAGTRIGYANAAELGWLGLTKRVAAPRGMHTVDRMLALAEAAGAPSVRDMRLYPPVDAERDAPELVASGTRYGVIAPTSRWVGKRWPADRFVRVTESLVGADGGLDACVIVGSPGERGQCGPLLDLAARDGRIIDLIGRTSIGELMALIRRSEIVIANDSAAIHMAVGFDRPMVALYGPTRLELVGPYGREEDVVQHINASDSMDYKNNESGARLMARITAEEVTERAMARIAVGTSGETPVNTPDSPA